MARSALLNYLSLAVFSAVLSGFGIVTAVILLTSVPPTIADLLPLLIAFLLGHKLYSLAWGTRKYGPFMGLELLGRSVDFLKRRKAVLSAVVLVGFVIWFRELVPPNLLTSVLFLFLNPFSQLTLNLSAFFGRLFAEIVTLGVQLWFVYLVADAVAGLYGKMLKRGRGKTRRR